MTTSSDADISSLSSQSESSESRREEWATYFEAERPACDAACCAWIMGVPQPLPMATPPPRWFYRVQRRSAALDRWGNVVADAQERPALGMNPEGVFADATYEFRINKGNVERALDPENRVPTGLIGLCADFGEWRGFISEVLE